MQVEASEVVFAASSYLQDEYPDGRVHCTFVMGKARSVPMKFVSIPRLELQAAVLVCVNTARRIRTEH